MILLLSTRASETDDDLNEDARKSEIVKISHQFKSIDSTKRGWCVISYVLVLTV